MADPTQQAPLSAAAEEVAPGAGYQVKVGPKGQLTPAGNITLDPSQNSELLAQMQEMVKRRENPMNIFLEGLKDATAWGAGRDQGPTEALAVRGAQRQKEEDQLFNMKAQMAAMKAASAQQEAFNRQRQAELMGGGGGGAGGAPEFGTIGSLPPLARSTLAAARTPEEYNKLKARYAELAMNPEWQKPSKYVDEQGNIQEAPLYRASRESAAGFSPSAAGATGVSIPLESIQRAVFSQESSSGRADTSKPNYAGAMGPMQILPETFEGLKKEGLIPKDADIANPTHNKAAGDALLGKYYKKYGGDANKTLAAYYGGEGAINKDGTINLDWKDKQNPNAPTVGQYIAQVKQKAGLTSAPAQVAGAAPKRISMGEAETLQKGSEAQAVAEGTATGKLLGGKEATIIEAKDTAGERLSSLEYLDKLISDPKTSRAFGIFQKPDFVSAVGAVVDKGIKLGTVGDIGVDLEPLVRANMKGASQAEIDAAQKATREFAKIKLNEAKILLAGSGSVSDAERALIQELSGSIKNSPGALKDYLAWGKMRAEYDRKAGDALDAWRANNPKGSFNQFRLSPQAAAVRKEYEDKLDAFATKGGLNSYQGAKSTQEQQPAPKWNHSEEEWAAWKKRKGI